MKPEAGKNTLTNSQKKFLRKLGHGLSPVVYIGKEGLSETVAEAIDAALNHHELIKVKIINTDKLSKHKAAEQIPEQCGCQLVQLIGKTLLLFRPSTDKKREERIRLPNK
ncbi:MAG: ribosome assembly RNA-binding protein YhbY [Desulfofustis sp.]